jgi:hypothetical protein
LSDYSAFLARGTFAAILASKSEEVGDCLEWVGLYGAGSTASVPLIKTRFDRGNTQNLIVPRLVWLAAHGEIPDGRIVYRHHCCNDRCVLLEHLKLGRRGDQLRRRAALGMAKHMQSTRAAITRSARNRSTTRYSEEQARAIRELAAAGVPDQLIAGATDVALSMVGDIRRGDAWADRAPAASVFGWRP